MIDGWPLRLENDGSHCFNTYCGQVSWGDSSYVPQIEPGSRPYVFTMLSKTPLSFVLCSSNICAHDLAVEAAVLIASRAVVTP